MVLSDVCLYLDAKVDESYTPNRISVRAGSDFHDLTELQVVDLTDPCGWYELETLDSDGRPVRAFMVQVAILSNHQNGRDTHVRQVKIHTPVKGMEEIRDEEAADSVSDVDYMDGKVVVAGKPIVSSVPYPGYKLVVTTKVVVDDKVLGGGRRGKVGSAQVKPAVDWKRSMDLR